MRGDVARTWQAFLRNINAVLARTNQSHRSSVRFCSSGNVVSPYLYADDEQVRVRFAPSPTGPLHIGGLRTALYNYLFACKQRQLNRSASFILRIEDTDSTRFVPGAVESLKAMLDWAGIRVDEGPDVGGPYGPYVQSNRVGIYKEHARQIVADGTAYYCFCSPTRLDLARKEAFRHGRTPGYDNKCRQLDATTSRRRVEQDGEPACVRLRYDKVFPVDDIVFGHVSPTAVTEGDPVLLKQDGMPTYHFANVIDDYLMRITHVLRGAEWLSSTPKHLSLYQIFGWKPPKFAHLPLLLDVQGRKLSKRLHKDQVSVNAYVERGIYPEALLSFLCSSGSGFSKTPASSPTTKFPNESFDLSRRLYVATMQELIDHFELDMVHANPCRVAPLDRVLELNHMVLLQRYQTDPENVKAEFRRLIETCGEQTIFKHDDNGFDEDQIQRALDWGINTHRVRTLNELLHDQNFSKRTNTSTSSIRQQSKQIDSVQLDDEVATRFLMEAAAVLRKYEAEPAAKAISALQSFVNSSQTIPNRKTAWHLVRTAITGKPEGAPVAELLHVLGVKIVRDRLQTHIAGDKSAALC